jgi:hypothetical protein
MSIFIGLFASKFASKFYVSSFHSLSTLVLQSLVFNIYLPLNMPIVYVCFLLIFCLRTSKYLCMFSFDSLILYLSQLSNQIVYVFVSMCVVCWVY